jgi:hypothetical protein
MKPVLTDRQRKRFARFSHWTECVRISGNRRALVLHLVRPFGRADVCRALRPILLDDAPTPKSLRRLTALAWRNMRRDVQAYQRSGTV